MATVPREVGREIARRYVPARTITIPSSRFGSVLWFNPSDHSQPFGTCPQGFTVGVNLFLTVSIGSSTVPEHAGAGGGISMDVELLDENESTLLTMSVEASDNIETTYDPYPPDPFANTIETIQAATISSFTRPLSTVTKWNAVRVTENLTGDAQTGGTLVLYYYPGPFKAFEPE